MLDVDDYLLAKLVSSGVLRADEPILEASMEMAGSWRRVGSQVTASTLGPVCAVRSPGSVAGRRVGRMPGSAAGARCVLVVNAGSSSLKLTVLDPGDGVAGGT
jgi:hypothetical protein